MITFSHQAMIYCAENGNYFDITLRVSDRSEFDQITTKAPEQRCVRDDGSVFWNKSTERDGLSINFYTDEPPMAAAPIPEPVTAEQAAA